jgi:tricorn protease
LSPGDVITKVNGNSVALNEALYRDVLNEQVGRNLVLNVTGADGKERVVNLRAISTGEFSSIVSSNLFESTRKMVEEKSKGTLTYVNIPAMSGGALTEFQQQLWKYARDKKGVIIDVRFNSGGNTADQIIDILERKQNMNYYPRDEQVIVGPGQVLDMPIVVLISEQSYSNGEMFPDAMRTLKMATLIGKRTPGYVIYTYGLPLVDGTIGRMPSTGVYRVDGSNMENNGVKPDIEVDRNFVDWTSGLDKQVEAAIEFLMKKSGKQTK